MCRGSDKRAPTDGAGQEARMMEAREEPKEILPSVEAAIQLRSALEAKDRTKQEFLSCQDLAQLPELARDYVLAAEAAKLAASVVQDQAGLYQQPIHSIPVGAIINRG